jgi:glutathione S-transferase
MSDLILHHYPMSPFSEKIRVMLGYTGLNWQSVITREMPPRPQLEILAGGYRKIPVGQIGADVFCDSRLIAAEIAALSGKPELALENCPKAQQDYVSEVDLQVFFACIMVASTKAMRKKFRQALSVPDMLRFLWDRLNMGRKATFKAVGLRDSASRVKEHLNDLESRLKHPFLFGKKPAHADFSTYHSLWFLRELAESPLLEGHPRTIAWMNRMQAFGHGVRHEISAGQALNIAKGCTPRPIAPEHQNHELIGRQVSIAPADYGQIPTSGRLVGITPTSWILARKAGEGGTVHVHFPQNGYRLTAE